ARNNTSSVTPAVITLNKITHHEKPEAICEIEPVSDGSIMRLTKIVSIGTNRESKIPKPIAKRINFHDNASQPMLDKWRFSTNNTYKHALNAKSHKTAKPIK